VNTQENEMKKVYALLVLGERSNKIPLVMSKKSYNLIKEIISQ